MKVKKNSFILSMSFTAIYIWCHHNDLFTNKAILMLLWPSQKWYLRIFIKWNGVPIVIRGVKCSFNWQKYEKLHKIVFPRSNSKCKTMFRPFQTILQKTRKKSIIFIYRTCAKYRCGQVSRDSNFWNIHMTIGLKTSNVVCSKSIVSYHFNVTFIAFNGDFEWFMYDYKSTNYWNFKDKYAKAN